MFPLPGGRQAAPFLEPPVVPDYLWAPKGAHRAAHLFSGNLPAGVSLLALSAVSFLGSGGRQFLGPGGR